MNGKSLMCVASMVFALASAPAAADSWDLTPDNDDSFDTDNTLVHGSVQVHDLGVRPGPVADQDWFIVVVPPYSSYEVQIDGMTGDIGNALLTFDRLDAFATVVQTGTFVSSFDRRIAWQNQTNAPVQSYIRVANPDCSTTCTTNSVYTIRARETTVNVARFNASGSQATILLSQNASDVPVTAYFFYWSATGTLLATGSLTNQAAKALNVFNIGSSPTLTGQSGHITIAHNAPYGKFNVKSVALEPSTGFSFDTPGTIRP